MVIQFGVVLAIVAGVNKRGKGLKTYAHKPAIRLGNKMVFSREILPALS